MSQSDESAAYNDLVLSCRKGRRQVAPRGQVTIDVKARLARLRDERARLVALFTKEGAADGLALLDARIAALATAVKNLERKIKKLDE